MVKCDYKVKSKVWYVPFISFCQVCNFWFVCEDIYNPCLRLSFKAFYWFLPMTCWPFPVFNMKNHQSHICLDGMTKLYCINTFILYIKSSLICANRCCEWKQFCFLNKEALHCIWWFVVMLLWTGGHSVQRYDFLHVRYLCFFLRGSKRKCIKDYTWNMTNRRTHTGNALVSCRQDI